MSHNQSPHATNESSYMPQPRPDSSQINKYFKKELQNSVLILKIENIFYKIIFWLSFKNQNQSLQLEELHF